MILLLILPTAFCLDLIFGDPEKFPHPVRLMGKFIIFCETFIRSRLPKTSQWEKRGGLILAVVVMGVSFLAPLAIILTAYKINGALGILVHIILCYWLIAVKSMNKEASSVFDELKKDDLDAARQKLSRIVGRDTKNLDEKGIIKATVESVSENTCDGVVAPLFFMAIGGAPLGFLYKAVNTLDSMVGYKNEKYKDFGYFSAKIDDVLNFIPARITGLFYIFAAYCLGYNGKGARKIFFRDRLKHASPNSAHGEAAAAGALNIALGGASYYGGVLVEKPVIGDDIKTPEPDDINKSIQMLYLASIWALIFFCAARFIVLFIEVLA